MYASMTKKEYMSYIGSMSMNNGAFYSIIEGVADASSPLRVASSLFFVGISDICILSQQPNCECSTV
jgi:hypothetical protein